MHSISGDGFSYPELKEFVDPGARHAAARCRASRRPTSSATRTEKIYIEMSHQELADARHRPAADLAERLQGQNDDRSRRASFDTGCRSIYLRSKATSTRSSRFATSRMPRRRPGCSGSATSPTCHRGFVDPPAAQVPLQRPRSVRLGVSWRKGGNVIEVGNALDAKLERFEAALPVGRRGRPDRPTSREVVRDRSANSCDALGEALIIVLAVSLLSLGLRTGLVVAVAIPLVLAATFCS